MLKRQIIFLNRARFTIKTRCCFNVVRVINLPKGSYQQKFDKVAQDYLLHVTEGPSNIEGIRLRQRRETNFKNLKQ